MAQYLSQEWFEEMEAAAASHLSDQKKEGRVTLRETITGTPFGDVSYVMTVDDGVISLTRDESIVADVTFSQTYETAAALHRSEMTTHEAFFAGKVRVAGHLNTLLEHADLLQGIAPIFEKVRQNTTY